MQPNEKPVFNIYQKPFICDCCGESTIMGIVGFSKQYPKICDLCLVNEVLPCQSCNTPTEKNTIYITNLNTTKKQPE